MEVKKITKQAPYGDTRIIIQAVNHNAEVLECALNRIKESEKQLEKEREVEKYEKDAKGIQKLRKNISQFLTEFGNADDEITKAQMYVLKCCLTTIEE